MNPLVSKASASAGWRRLLWSRLKKIIFRMDPERAHGLVVGAIREVSRFGYAPLRIMTGSPHPEKELLPAGGYEVPGLGMTFLSRVGLAAGFDKDAELVPALPHLGFGFAEIGTVTPLPQPGNDRPRLFRDPGRQALFNCMGFNGQGARAAAERLALAKPALPRLFRVGVNLGKNKVTPLEEAARDYALAAEPFEGLADYLVINVSSPNTPGLRQLQAEETLKPIVEAVLAVTSRWKTTPPVLLKLAPELRSEALIGVILNGPAWGIGGWVLTNTLGGTHESGLSGGWSGAILTELSRKRLSEVRALTPLPIISVGGIMDAEEAVTRAKLGADLIQIYTGWIYAGGSLPGEITRRLCVKLT